MKHNDIVVVGLGTFGYELAISLEDNGIHVMGIDIDEKIVNSIKDDITVSLAADITNRDVIKKLEIPKFEKIILCISSSLETLILAITYLKRMGAKHITAKANTKIQEEILLRVGADKVIAPEVSTAKRLAKALSHPTILESFFIDSENSLMEVIMPKKYAGKSLMELDFRRKYNINVVMQIHDNKKEIVTDPSIILSEGDTLLVAGDEKNILKAFEG